MQFIFYNMKIYNYLKNLRVDYKLEEALFLH